MRQRRESTPVLFLTARGEQPPDVLQIADLGTDLLGHNARDLLRCFSPTPSRRRPAGDSQLNVNGSDLVGWLRKL
jgi:hypothetical protein